MHTTAPVPANAGLHDRLRSLRAATLLLFWSAAALAAIPGLTISRKTDLGEIHPRNVAAAPDGKVWFSEERYTPHKLGWFDPAGTLKRFDIPCDGCADHSKMTYVESIVVGPDSNLWFIYSHVGSDGAPLNGGDNNYVGRVTPDGVFTSFKVATKDAFRRYLFGGAGSSMIAVGPDGNLWFTENVAGKVGKITTAGVITEYPLAQNFASPSGVTAGPDGNVWVTETLVDKVARITPAGAIKEFSLPSSAYATSIVSAAGRLWFSNGTSVGSMTTDGAFTNHPLEGSQTVAADIVLGPDGNLYFPSYVSTGSGTFEGRLNQMVLNPGSAGTPVIQTHGGPFHFEVIPDGSFGSDLAWRTDNTLLRFMFMVGAVIDGTNGGNYVDYLYQISLKAGCPAIAVDGDPGVAKLNQPYVYFFQVFGGTPPYTWTAEMLPPGFTLSSTEGFIQGTPTQTGTFPIKLRVKDANDCEGREDTSLLVVDTTTRTTSKGNQPNSGTVADPISSTTGEYYFEERPDLLLRGPMPLTFQRYYGSALPSDGNVSSALGDGWTHNFDFVLKTIVPELLRVVTDRGRVVDFVKNGSAWVLSDPGDIPYQLVVSGSGFVFADPRNDVVRTFDASGRLVKVENGRGAALTLTWNGALLAEVGDGLGRKLKFTYDGSGLMATVSDGTRTVTFTHSGRLLTSAKDAAGATTTYSYTGAALLTARTLPLGNSITRQTYDASGRVAAQTTGNDHVTTLSYGAAQTVVVDAAGKSHSHTWAGSSGQLQSATDEAGRTATVTSDTSGRRQQVSDREGATTAVTYHAGSGKVASITAADGGLSTFSYTARSWTGVTLYDLTAIGFPDGSSETRVVDGSGNVVSRIDREGRSWTYTWNARGQMLTAKNPLNGTTTFTYNADGTVATITDPDGVKATYAYDALRRITRDGRGEGVSTTYTYDAGDRITSIKDGRGNTWRFEYDANGNLTRAFDPGNAAYAYAYDALDRLVQTTDRTGGVTRYAFDPRELLTAVTDANGLVTTFGYDDLRRRTSITDAAGKSWTFGWTAERMLASITSPLGERLEVTTSVMGSLAGLKDPLGQTTTVTRDALQRVTSMRDPLTRQSTFAWTPSGLATATRPSGSAVFSRNALGQVSKVRDPNGEEWTFDVTAGGRPKSQTDPEGRSTTYAWDAAGRVKKQTFPAGSVTYTYDASGNTTRADYSAGPTLDFTWDTRNRLTGAEDLTLAYDDEGRVIRTTRGGTAFEADYDAGGRLTALRYDNGAFTVSYAWDSRDRVTSVGDSLTGASVSFAYDDVGRVTGMSRSNGVTSTFVYDAAGRVTSIREGSFLDLTYAYDAAGQVRNIAGTWPATISDDATSLDMTAPVDAASQVSGSGHSYDTRGRVTKLDSRSFTWDGASRLTASGTVTFTWDAFGRMQSRTEGGVTTTFLYANSFPLFAPAVEEKSGSAVARWYVRAPNGALLYAIDGVSKALSFYHFDRNGSTLALTNAAGAVTDAWAYEPYGAILARSGPSSQPFTWSGRYGVIRDATLGMYSMGVRWYDPRTARFLTPDPIPSRDPLAMTPYHYALGNPMSFTDPAGLSPDDGAACPCPAAPQIGGNAHQSQTKLAPVAPPLTGAMSLPPDIAAVSTQWSKPKVITGSVLILRETSGNDSDLFKNQEEYFEKILKARGIKVVKSTVEQVGGLQSNPNADIGVSASELKEVTGVITIGHSSPEVIGEYISPAAMNALFDRTGPLQMCAMWGCNSFGFYENYDTIFLSHAAKKGPFAVFGFSSFLNPGACQNGFSKAFWQSDPFVEFIDGRLGGGEYSTYDLSGAFWGWALGRTP